MRVAAPTSVEEIPDNVFGAFEKRNGNVTFWITGDLSRADGMPHGILIPEDEPKPRRKTVKRRAKK
jgi:hypothetical protein